MSGLKLSLSSGPFYASCTPNSWHMYTDWCPGGHAAAIINVLSCLASYGRPRCRSARSEGRCSEKCLLSRISKEGWSMHMEAQWAHRLQQCRTSVSVHGPQDTLPQGCEECSYMGPHFAAASAQGQTLASLVSVRGQHAARMQSKNLLQTPTPETVPLSPRNLDGDLLSSTRTRLGMPDTPTQNAACATRQL